MFIIENGTPIELWPDGSARRGEPVTAGYVYVDGLSVGEFGDIVLREPALAVEGRDVHGRQATGHLVGRPEIVTRGFVRGNENDPSLEGAIERIISAVETQGDHLSEIALLKTQIKDGVSRYLYEQTKRRPMVFPVVVEV